MVCKRRRSGKKLSKKADSNVNSTKRVCLLCDIDCDEVYLGELLTVSGVSVHENCLYFSPVLHQKLDPSIKRNGYLLGFSIPDIKKEISRINRLKCFVCKRKKAGIGCCKDNCKRSYHLFCGLRCNAVGIFADSFTFWCSEHANRQDLRKQIDSCDNIVPECAACLDSMAAAAVETDAANYSAPTEDEWAQFMHNVASRQVIHAGCCTRAWLHRSCMVKHCLASGLHHIKCPNCGNKSVYIDTAIKCGLWIPDRDAAWEMEPGAFQDMYEEVVMPVADDADDNATNDMDALDPPIIVLSDDDSTILVTSVSDVTDLMLSDGADVKPVDLSSSITNEIPPNDVTVIQTLLGNTNVLSITTDSTISPTNDENKQPIVTTPTAESSNKSVPVAKTQSDIRKFFSSQLSCKPIASCPSNIHQSQVSSSSSRKRALSSNRSPNPAPVKRRHKRQLSKSPKKQIITRKCSKCSRSLLSFNTSENNARPVLAPKSNVKVDHICCSY